jgi:hypothetical protein
VIAAVVVGRACSALRKHDRDCFSAHAVGATVSSTLQDLIHQLSYCSLRF